MPTGPTLKKPLFARGSGNNPQKCDPLNVNKMRHIFDVFAQKPCGAIFFLYSHIVNMYNIIDIVFNLILQLELNAGLNPVFHLKLIQFITS